MSFLEGKYVKLVEFFCCDDFTLGLADFNKCHLLHDHVRSDSGIITPYRAQQSLIAQKLSKEKLEVKVATVDAYQGTSFCAEDICRNA